VIEKQSKGAIGMARKRTVKDGPKRGKLTKSQIKRAVEKVVYSRRDAEKSEAGRTLQEKSSGGNYQETEEN
jgi:hypothetical protein